MGCTKSMLLIRPDIFRPQGHTAQPLAHASRAPDCFLCLLLLRCSIHVRRRSSGHDEEARQAQSEKRGTDRVPCVKNTKPGGPSAQPKPRPVLAHQEGWPTGQRLRASLPSRFLPPSLMGHGSCALGRTEWEIELGLPPQI